jgi:hypothetical protein
MKHYIPNVPENMGYSSKMITFSTNGKSNKRVVCEYDGNVGDILNGDHINDGVMDISQS